jgi:dihydrofolate reductase
MDAAGGKDVALGGGADVAQQYLRAGLIDEMEVHVVPRLLGGGARLFDGLEGRYGGLQPVRVITSPAVTHYKYRLSG